jgi:hypothetical protein
MGSDEQVMKIVNYISKLINLGPGDVELIQQHRDFLLSCADEIVKSFYDTLFSVEETRAVFHEGERPAREQTLRDWFARTVVGPIDERYWKWQWFVGTIHIKRGVKNPMAVSQAANIQDIILTRAVQALGPEQGQQLYRSFKKLMTVVIGLVAEGYTVTLFEALSSIAGISPALANTQVALIIDEEIERVRKEL